MAHDRGRARLLTIAAQMVSLGAEAESAVRSAQGAAEQLRLVAPSPIVEFVDGPAGRRVHRAIGRVDRGVGRACRRPPRWRVLVSQRLADVALGPYLGADRSLGLVSEPIFRCRPGRARVARRAASAAHPRQWPWLVEPAATDPGSDVSRLLRTLGCAGIPAERLPQPDRGVGRRGPRCGGGPRHRPPRRAPAAPPRAAGRRRAGHAARAVLARDDAAAPTGARAAAASLRHFLGTPEAMKLLRAPGAGVPPSRFRPPVYVTIWS